MDQVESLNFHEEITCLGLGVMFHLTRDDFAYKSYQPLLRRVVVVFLLLALRYLVPRLEKKAVVIIEMKSHGRRSNFDNHISLSNTVRKSSCLYYLPRQMSDILVTPAVDVLCVRVALHLEFETLVFFAHGHGEDGDDVCARPLDRWIGHLLKSRLHGVEMRDHELQRLWHGRHGCRRRLDKPKFWEEN